MQTVQYHYTEEVQTYKAFSESAGHMIQRKAMPPLRDNKCLGRHACNINETYANIFSVPCQTVRHFCENWGFAILFVLFLFSENIKILSSTHILQFIWHEKHWNNWNIFGLNTRKTCSADIVVYNILVKSSQNYSVKNVIGKKGAR